jgi:5-methylcytosine-specific restriction endonuclease McrA
MSIPSNNYFLWLRENRENIKTMYFTDYEIKTVKGKKENISTLISKKAGEVWKSLDSSIKDKYNKQLQVLKAADLSTKSKAILISDELCKFLGKKPGFEMSISDGIDGVMLYVEKKNLTVSGNKISVDKKLGKLLGVCNKDNVSSTNLMKYLSNHYQDSENEEDLEDSVVEAPPPAYMEEVIVDATTGAATTAGVDAPTTVTPPSSVKKPRKNIPKTVTSPSSVKKPRKNIPKTVKKTVWNTFIETDDPNKLRGKCFVGCGTDINIDNFELGHIVAHSNGGGDNVDNLRPICGLCNKSMGTENLLDFKEKYGLNNITDPAYFVEKLEECSHLHTSLMAEQEPLLLTTEKFNQNISDIDDNTECLTNMITLNKDNLSKNTSDYNKKVSALKLELKKLDTKHITETTLITATIDQDVAKIKTNAQTVLGIKSKIAIADDNIRMNQSKIDNLVETTKMYQSKLSAIELHAKNKQLEIEAELEAEVKEEIARDVLKQKIKDRLLNDMMVKSEGDLINLGV